MGDLVFSPLDEGGDKEEPKMGEGFLAIGTSGLRSSHTGKRMWANRGGGEEAVPINRKGMLLAQVQQHAVLLSSTVMWEEVLLNDHLPWDSATLAQITTAAQLLFT